MKSYLLGVLYIALNLVAINTAAVSIYECVDEEGTRTFQERCPPGTSPVEEKKYITGKKEQSSTTANINAIIYTVPDCEPCDLIREFFQARNISFTDKNVKDNIEVQTELNEIAGQLSVPYVIIGDHKIGGYDRNKLLNAIKEGGYIEPETSTETSNQETPVTTTPPEETSSEPPAKN